MTDIGEAEHEDTVRTKVDLAPSEGPKSEGSKPEGPEPEEQPRTFAQAFLYNLWSANSVVVTILSLLLATVIGGILIIVATDQVRETFGYFFSRPSDAINASWSLVSEAYGNLFRGSIVDPAAVTAWLDGTGRWQLVFYPISETLNYAMPLTFTGLSVAIAFRGGLFNIGAQGQAIMGVTVAAVLGFALHLPVGLHLAVVLLGAVLGGSLWGFLPGILKARTGAHEVITTIMLNYIALYFLFWLLLQHGVRNTARSDAISKDLDPSAKFPRLLGDELRVTLGIGVAILAAWAVSWMLKRSTFGFELRAVGSNPEAARTAGMSVPRTIIILMVLSGALAGLGGGSVVMGAQANALTGSVAGTIGFDGILVALLGRVRPWGVVLAALLFGALRAGANRMQSYTDPPISGELAFVLQALIVLFVAAPALVKTLFQLRAARASRLEHSMAKGW